VLNCLALKLSPDGWVAAQPTKDMAATAKKIARISFLISVPLFKIFLFCVLQQNAK
jgi:hypothetical protein